MTSLSDTISMKKTLWVNLLERRKRGVPTGNLHIPSFGLLWHFRLTTNKNRNLVSLLSVCCKLTKLCAKLVYGASQQCCSTEILYSQKQKYAREI